MLSYEFLMKSAVIKMVRLSELDMMEMKSDWYIWPDEFINV
jgi:hypothetical protein